MRKFILPSKDLSIYQAYSRNNSGLDEILEIGKTPNRETSTPVSYVSSSTRILMDFDLPTTESVPATATYYLNLRLANATDVQRKQKLVIYKVSQSWDEGSGYFYQNVKNVNDGATWKQRITSVEQFNFIGDGTTTTFTASNNYEIIEPLTVKVNSSLYNNTDYTTNLNRLIFDVAPPSSSTIEMYALVGTLWSTEGGSYLTSSVSQSVSLTTYPIEDLRIDVTNIFQPLVSQSLQNSFYGIVIKFPDLDELNQNNIGNIKFFSSQTHTIHVPTLEVAWDNQSFSTGSLKPIPSTNVKVATTNLKEMYSRGDVSRVNLIVRDEYPQKSFDSTLRYKNKYYLPTSSYYSIVDVQSNTAIVPFDNYSKINCDSDGAYIVLDTTPLFANRYYTLNFKFQTGSYTRTVETGTLFKIV